MAPLINILIFHFINSSSNSQIAINNYKMIKSTLNDPDCEADPIHHMRNYEVVSIRRNNREQHFQKRRVNASLDLREITTIPIDPALRSEEVFLEVFQPSDFYELIKNIQSCEPYLWFRSAVGLRKLVALDCSIGEKILQEGHVPAILALAQIEQHPQIMSEALWCLTNIFAAQNIDEDLVIECGVVQVLIGLLQRSSQFDSVIYQHTIICLGNMAADSQQIRDYIIDSQCISYMVKNLCSSEQMQLQTLNTTCWAFSNILRSHKIPPYSKVQAAVQYIACVLIQGIQNLETADLIADCLFVLSHHVSPKNGNLQEMKDRGLLYFVIKLCKESTDTIVILSCLRVIGNYSSGKKEYMVCMIPAGLMELLDTTLLNKSPTVRRESCWILSNMAANPIQIARHIYSNPKLLIRLKEMFQNDSINVQKEICFVFCNLCHCMMVEEYFKIVVAVELAQNIVYLLQFGEDPTVLGVLRCLSMVLSYFHNQSQTLLLSFLKHFERAQGYAQLDRLQQSDNENIYNLVNKLIEQFCKDQFDGGQVDKDTYALPNRDDNGSQEQKLQGDDAFYNGFEQFKRNNPL